MEHETGGEGSICRDGVQAPVLAGIQGTLRRLRMANDLRFWGAPCRRQEVEERRKRESLGVSLGVGSRLGSRLNI